MPSAEDAATHQAYFAGADEAARQAEAKWGIDRLPLLVDAELRAKFERQRVRFREALEAAWSADPVTRDHLERVASASGAMERAWQALDRAAEEAGHRPVIANVWEVALADGTIAAFVQSNAEAGKVVAEGRYLRVFTLAEVGNVLDALPELVNRAKETFPGATIQPRRTPSDRSWARGDGDAIPF
jgi:hypothetical protein